MAAYKSNRILYNDPPREIIPGVNMISEEFTFPAAPAANDTVEMFILPAGAVVIDMILDCDDLDGGAAIMLQVGDGTTADKFISATNVAQAGGIARMSKKGNIAQVLSNDTPVVVKVSTGPASGQTGTIRLACIYNMGK